MDVVIIVVAIAVIFSSGYAFRGAIGKELKTLGADIKADVAEIKAKVSKL